jgi:hypothetical protein
MLLVAAVFGVGVFFLSLFFYVFTHVAVVVVVLLPLLCFRCCIITVLSITVIDVV